MRARISAHTRQALEPLTESSYGYARERLGGNLREIVLSNTTVGGFLHAQRSDVLHALPCAFAHAQRPDTTSALDKHLAS